MPNYRVWRKDKPGYFDDVTVDRIEERDDGSVHFFVDNPENSDEEIPFGSFGAERVLKVEELTDAGKVRKTRSAKATAKPAPAASTKTSEDEHVESAFAGGTANLPEELKLNPTGGQNADNRAAVGDQSPPTADDTKSQDQERQAEVELEDEVERQVQEAASAPNSPGPVQGSTDEDPSKSKE